MSYVFLVPEKIDSWSNIVISGEISAEFFFSNIFIAPKDSSLNFRWSVFSYCLTILLISAVITILEDFGSLMPACSVTVKIYQT